mmetsp:Transcript_37126/g.84044  ORF Transcript_37126/g.84044 Transcript_37126/m.84044 type:complete len:135 (-) Transcript_37126:1030-1434(-)
MYVCVFKKSETEVLVSLDRDTVEKYFREQLCAYESTLFSMDLAWKIKKWAPKEVMRQIYLDWKLLEEPRLKQYLSLVGTDVFAPEGGIRDNNGILEGFREGSTKDFCLRTRISARRTGSTIVERLSIYAQALPA